jgi:nuclear GTP-binding protein
MKTHHHGSKRTKLKQKYNIQKRVKEHKRRMKKEAKRLGLQKKVHKDPGIPNSWPFKAEMLAELEQKKEQRDAEMEARRAKAKSKAKHDHKQMDKDRREVQQLREEARKEKRAKEALDWHNQAFRRNVPGADVILHVLDSRDPMGCRCAALESWAQEQKKKLVFVLTKADLITPEMSAKWVLHLGQVTPTVAVQAEAGREGIRELLMLVGQAPAKSGLLADQVTVAKSVVVLGYAGSGKKALCKAMRQEVKTTAAWLLDPCRLLPVDGQAPTASTALHAVVCGSVPRGAATRTSAAMAVSSGSGAGAIPASVDPVDVIKELLARVPQQKVMRHYRLPTFEGPDAFLKIFCADRKIKNKKGKDAEPAYVAKRVLTELPALPGCFCMAPETATAGTPNYWAAHADSRQKIQVVMEEQVKTLAARGASGPAATALTIASGANLGPTVDVVKLLEDDELHVEGEDDVSDSDESGSDEGMSDGEGEYEEGEEEEGEESEEESMSDV